jgi:hypothetical protein
MDRPGEHFAVAAPGGAAKTGGTIARFDAP